jgi:hypothetical protein
MAMELPPPGVSLADLPMPFHQMGKNVFWLNQREPTIMLTTTHTTTAHQLMAPISTLASFG